VRVLLRRPGSGNPSAEAGVTLIELLVAMALLSIVTVLMLAMVTGVFRGQKSARLADQATNQARTSLERVDDQSRTATFVWVSDAACTTSVASGTCVVLAVPASPATQCYAWKVDSTGLSSQSWLAGATRPTTWDVRSANVQGGSVTPFVLTAATAPSPSPSPSGAPTVSLAARSVLSLDLVATTDKTGTYDDRLTSAVPVPMGGTSPC
jgi:prepilin-type N-terminal cleavage/methylation domain-containing protein